MPNSCTTFAPISMLYYRLEATDWTGAYVRAALLDHKKAFNHVHHNLLISKFYNLGVKPTVVTWVIDFFRGRSKPVKLSSDGFSDFTPVPAGISQGARIGPWLSLVLATSCSLVSGMWKFLRRHHGPGNCSPSPVRQRSKRQRIMSFSQTTTNSS